MLCFSPNKRHMSAISLSTQQYMISIVNTDCYKSPPVQTRTLFAKLLTPAFEEMTVCGSWASVLLVFEGCKRSAYDGYVYTLWVTGGHGCLRNSLLSTFITKYENNIFHSKPRAEIKPLLQLLLFKSLSLHGHNRLTVIIICISLCIIYGS